MRRIIIIIVCTTIMTGCQHNNTEGTSTQEASIGKTISFFDKPLVMDDSTHVMLQIMEIAEGDEMLSVDGTILTIGNISFKINLLGDGVTLISSIPLDDPKMEQVIKYFDSIYDPMPENGANDFYSWRKKGTDGVYHNVRMRPLHSEEGGTTIMFS